MERKRKIAVVAGLLLGSAFALAALAVPGDRYRIAGAESHAAASSGHQPLDGGVAGDQPCGDGAMTQSSFMTILDGHVQQCVNAAGVPSDNGLARSFNIGADTSVCGVQFGVEKTDGAGPWPVKVNLYEGNVTGPFAELTLRGSASVTIPPNTSLQHFSAVFDEPVQFFAGEKMVVELFIKGRAINEGGDGGQMFLGSNNLGQSAASYIRASTCNIHDFQTYASIGLPNNHLVMKVFTGVTAPQPGACCIDSGAAPCPADLTGSGTVGVPDLLALLSKWGPCPAPCNADLTGSGSVGVPDLLALLSQWGACPGGGGSTVCQVMSIVDCAEASGQFHGANTSCVSPSSCPTPPGACCLGAGACQNVTAGECAQAGGEFKGEGTSCSQATCDLGPACPPGAMQEGEPCGADVNGGCEAPGTPAYTSISCGQSVCGSAWAHNNQRDTDWYTVTVTQQTNLSWSVDSAFQAQVAILNDQCGSGLKELATGNSEPGSSVTTASACLAPGTYHLFVAIDDFDNHACGGGKNNYVASLSCEPCELEEPEGETCDDAIPVAIGGTAVGNNEDNEWDVDVYCDDFVQPESGVVWFQVVGDGTQLTAFNANLPGTVWQTQMYVYCGTCDAPGCTGQPVSHPNFGAAYSWCSEAGQTYYLAVWGVFGLEGDISIGVTSGDTCTAPPCEAGGLCKEICGGQSSTGCWCDNTCHLLTDCCPGLCVDCPGAAACHHECVGLCGQQAPSGCWCDAECSLFVDCCEGICDACPNLPACGAPSCAGQCGGGYPAGCFQDQSCFCFCDESCWLFGDCCDDVCDECPGMDFCP